MGPFVRLASVVLLTFAMTAAPAVGGNAGDGVVEVHVEQVAPNHSILQYRLGDFSTRTVNIGGWDYEHVMLGHESRIKARGCPDLPNVCRSIIIPDDAEMSLKVVRSEYYELQDVNVAPSKGLVMRSGGPEEVPYSFDKIYDIDEFYPRELASLRDPYILRDHRAVVVELNPLQYNPVKRTLRVYTEVELEIVEVGPGQINVLSRGDKGRGPDGGDRAPTLAFHELYQNQFLNYAVLLDPDAIKLYTPPEMLIICHDAWLPNIQPLVVHKNAIGLSTTAVAVSIVGNNAASIKSYIQGVYDEGDLAYVLLVGDAAHVATPMASGGAADPTYAKLAGTDDYPDIVVGRFSAETAADVDTQVQRTIAYETLPATGQAWFNRGAGIASNQGPGDDGEYDNQHIDNIRADLIGAGYTVVDQIYDPAGTAAQVTTAVNAGRGIITYCGHGSTNAWTSTGFSSTQVNSLTNDNMLPFIFSVACVNGDFSGGTCFGEAWLRATNGTAPAGAIGAYMSSINQSWNPPMCAEDAFVDLLVADAHASFGAMCFAGSCQMIDEYGAGGAAMFDTWHIFGDPSVRIVAEDMFPEWTLPLFEIEILEPWPWPGPLTPLGHVDIQYAEGNLAVITALPRDGAVFSHWEGDVPEGREHENPLSLVMTRDLNLTPVFEELGIPDLLDGLDCGSLSLGTAAAGMMPLMLGLGWRRRRRNS